MNTRISDSPTQNIQRSDKAVFEVLMMNNYSAMENKILNVGFTMKKISANFLSDLKQRVSDIRLAHQSKESWNQAFVMVFLSRHIT